MGETKNWFRFAILKVFQFFNIDLLAENKELQDTVFTLKEKISKIEKENIELKKQTTEETLQFDPKFHYYKDNTGNHYCPHCYDVNKLAIHLAPPPNNRYLGYCTRCKYYVENPDYNDERFIDLTDPDRGKTGYGL